jgi:hypothetical protein
VDSLSGFAAGNSGVMLRTTDGGQNWISVESGTVEHIYGLHFRDSDRGWACGRNGTLLFWDGSAWAPLESGVDVSLMAIHFSDDLNGYAVGSGGTVIRTVNGGQAWAERPAPAGANPYLESLCFVDSLEGWCVGLGGTILHTTDGGATWDRQVSGALFGLEWVEFVNPREGWAGGYGGTLLHTVDGGGAWVSQKRNLPADAITMLRNVVCTLEGAASDQQIIVCGHFDSISEDPMNLAPGADDNGSGTAAVVEAARVLSQHRFQKTIKFICFSAEEIGLQGSGAYAPEASLRGDDIAGLLNLDMVGYVNAGPGEVDMVANPASWWLLDFAAACAAAYVPDLPARKITDATYLASDHASFWNSGYRALFVTEDVDVSYPYYHTTADTMGNLHMSFLESVTRMGIATLAEFAIPDSLTCAGRTRSRTAAMLMVSPNPSGGRVAVSFALAAEGRVRACVYTPRGRMVKAIADLTLPEGAHEVEWDGRDTLGRRVSPGVYLVRVEAAGRSHSSKVVVLE